MWRDLIDFLNVSNIGDSNSCGVVNYQLCMIEYIPVNYQLAAYVVYKAVIYQLCMIGIYLSVISYV